MTSESFAADLGSMLGDGADLAPLMGTFSFSGRDPNKDSDDSEEEKYKVRQTTRETVSNFSHDIDSNGEQQRQPTSFSGIPESERTTRQAEVTVHSSSNGSSPQGNIEQEEEESKGVSPEVRLKPVTSLEQMKQRDEKP